MGWQDDFRLRADLVQADVYAFDVAIRELGGMTVGDGASINSAHLLKAAISAGWIESPDVEVGEFDGENRWFIAGVDVDKHAPGAVLWYGGRVGAHYSKAIEIPPN